MDFYIGLHQLALAKHFDRCFISVNRLRQRLSDFRVDRWILDSGAFSELNLHGHYRYPPSEYAALVNRWGNCGTMEMAVTQDYMCEPFILAKTGLTIAEHQRLTIERYDILLRLVDVPLMPVLQGYTPDDYRRHLDSYGDRISLGARIGVGSICKRNNAPKEIVAVLAGIKKDRHDLRLHGFGLKLTALTNTYILSMLYSADSMAWSYAARRQGKNANGLKEAQAFHDAVGSRQGTKAHQMVMC